MFKWLWNLDKGVAGGWQELILRKYQPHFTNGLPVFTGSLSPTWRGMVSAISLNHSISAPIQSNVGFKVGDGRNIRFWSDSWLGYAAPLQFMFPRLYNLSLQQSLSVAEVHNPTDNSINLSWRRPLRSRELCMCESLIAEVERGLVFSDGEDNKIWKHHSSNNYTVSFGCHLFDSFNVSGHLHSPALLWNSKNKCVHMASFQWQCLHKGFLS